MPQNARDYSDILYILCVRMPTFTDILYMQCRTVRACINFVLLACVRGSSWHSHFPPFPRSEMDQKKKNDFFKPVKRPSEVIPNAQQAPNSQKFLLISRMKSERSF